MPSKARIAFSENAQDIKRLLELHQETGGIAPGRRYGLEVLNKSAIVLITAFWEAYCEDIAAEGLIHIVRHASSADELPKEIKQVIAKEIKADPHELAVWSVSDKGWRKVLQDRLQRLQELRDRKLNTPRAENIDQLFMSALGISSISSSWKWAKKMTVERAKKKLDKYVTLRGGIAHPGKAVKSVTNAHVEDYFNFIEKLAAKTGGAVNKQVKKVTGKPLWTK